MNKIDALRCELKCREMVEGTRLRWTDVVRFRGEKWTSARELVFSSDSNCYKFALGVVEDKPVWEGDTLYDANGEKYIAGITLFDSKIWSWNPPKPKTIMVELTIETAKFLCTFGTDGELSKACRKALESAKCK